MKGDPSADEPDAHFLRTGSVRGWISAGKCAPSCQLPLVNRLREAKPAIRVKCFTKKTPCLP